MPQLSFVTLDVFTQTKFKGNPLAVVLIPAGQDPKTETLQLIAREFNLSETAFIYLNGHDDATSNANNTNSRNNASDPETPPTIPSWRARIFMIDAELPFAGHPTIGTLCYALGSLAAPGTTQGRLQIPAGTVEAEFAENVARAAIPHNVHLHREAPFSVADIEALQPSLQGKRLLGIDTVSPVLGMNFVCVELEDLEALAVVECTGKRPAVKLDAEWDVGFVGALFYVRIGDEDVDGGKRVKLRTRMIEGNLEDPATGSASCALSAFLSLKGRVKRVDYELTQGVEMGRQSDIGILVTLNDALDRVERLEMSGSSVKVLEGKVEYE